MIVIALLPAAAEAQLRELAPGCLSNAYVHHEFVAWVDSAKRRSASFEYCLTHDFYLYLQRLIRQAIPETPSWWPLVITPDGAARLCGLLDTLAVSSSQPLQESLHRCTVTYPVYSPAKALDLVHSICRQMSDLVRQQRRPEELVLIHEYNEGDMK